MDQRQSETTALLAPVHARQRLDSDAESRSHVSRITREESALAATALGERLPYNNYTSIDWLHDLVSCAGSCNGPVLATYHCERL
jgi:chloride channel 3/4/5